MKGERGKVVVGLSGGVDSSVAAALLARDGHEVMGLFMKNWEEDDEPGYCAAAADLADATAVAGQLRIPLHTVSFAGEYWERVFERFLAEYRAGRTPNPDVLCNSEIKFSAFTDHARGLGARAIATGHYARTRLADGDICLLKGRDPDKDQSYFLHRLNQRQLADTLFPLGDMTKPEVRETARALGLATSDKRDSTGICFIGERPFRAFLERFLPARPGQIRSTEGARLGRHQGLMFYTLGQRKGLGIGGRADSGGSPWYVVDKDLHTNTLIVAQGEDHPRLYCDGLVVRDIHWIATKAPSLPLECGCKLRYRQADQPCRLEPWGDRDTAVALARPQRAATPGQYCVFYDGEVCLGGGVIHETIRHA